jgi:ABC-2 type transport system permease protein
LVLAIHKLDGITRRGTSALAWRAFADSRVRTGSFAALFLFIAYANVVGYRHTYPTLKERIAFARTFGANKAVELFYGAPHDLLTVGGYVAWRVGGVVSIFAAVWGVFAAVRALRAEEDAGRQELVLAGALSRRTAYLAALAAIAAGAAILWLALFVGLVAGRLDAGGSAYLGLAVVCQIPVFAGAGALASQLAPTRRLALELSTAALTVAFLLRVVADTASGLGWLRWATPLGWSEELRAFADPDPLVLALPVLTGTLLLAAAGAISARRDVGNGLLEGRDTAAPSLRLLSSPTALAARTERTSLVSWVLGIGAFALVTGLLSTSFTGAGISENLREELHKLGGAEITTPAGAIGFYFLLFVFAISLFACSQVAAIRREEAEQQLETLFALPVGRHRWLAGRLLLAAAGAAALALAAALLAWIGAASQGAGVSLPRLLEAGANCLPAALLFLALGALAFALLPRASNTIAYALVTVAFVWELIGALLGAPDWLLDLSPFQHVGLVPGQPFRDTAAAAMLAVAAGAVLLGLWSFRRRDLTGT